VAALIIPSCDHVMAKGQKGMQRHNETFSNLTQMEARK
jgi:hypothetical protein